MSGFYELFEASFQAVNLAYTLLLLLVVVYWVIVMFGMLDLSSLDLDLDAGDVDASAELPDGVDGIEAADSPLVFDGLLEYFNLRRAPLSVMISFFALSLWMIGVAANQYLNKGQSTALAFGIFFGNVLLSAHIAKFACLPLVPVFTSLRKETSGHRELMGSLVVVTSAHVDGEFGQVELQEEGAPITLLARTEGQVLNKGDEAVLLRKESDRDVYLVTKLDMEG